MKYFFIFVFTILLITSLFAQVKDTVIVKDYYSSGMKEGTLNDVVTSAISSGKLSNTVFKLQLNGLYVLNGTVTTPPGSVLEIVAPNPGNTQSTALPMIIWSSNQDYSKTYNFDCSGEVKMKNVWLFYGNLNGTQARSSFRVGYSTLSTSGKCTFTNVMFDYTPCTDNGSGAVEINAKHFIGKFINCYFKNCTDSHFRYYGRALSYNFINPGGFHADSVSFENCTFANLGEVLSQQNNQYADYVKFNHCTFLNVVNYTFESTWWYKLAITNCIFVNTFMFGANPSIGGSIFGGTISVDNVSNFGFNVPFTDQDRKILFTNNSYYLEQWLTDWMNNNPYSLYLRNNNQSSQIPVPQPMLNSKTTNFFESTDGVGNKIYPFINKANIFDATNPGFVLPTTNLDSLKLFLQKKWDDNSDCNWVYQISDDLNHTWPLKENLSYTNSTLVNAAMGSYPLGDLYHWWPAQYSQWAAQSTTESYSIDGLMNTPIYSGALAQYSIITTSIPTAGGTTIGTGNYYNNSTVKLIATPNAGYKFVNWSENGNVVSTNPTYSITINGNKNFVANFKVAAPAKIILFSPVNNATNIKISPSLIWRKSVIVEKYLLNVAIDSSFNQILVSDTSLTDTTKQLSGLTNSTKYYWKVRAKNIGGLGIWSDVGTFTTIVLAPERVVLEFPLNSSDQVSVTPILKWKKSKLSETYRVQVSTDTNFTRIVLSDSSSADTTKHVIGLSNITKYFWRVSSKNAGGVSLWSEVWNFKTIEPLPAIPILISPSNNSKYQELTVKLKWKKQEYTNTFRLVLARDKSLNNIIADDSTLSDTLKEIKELKEGTKYFWKVSSKNYAGQSIYTDLWNFTTILNAPDSLTIALLGKRKLKINWKDHSSNEKGFKIERKAGSNYILCDSVDANIISYVDTSSLATGSYQYRVKAFTNDTESKYSNETPAILVDVNEANSIPNKYYISQNYPNPFNPTTVLNYDLPTTTFVSLKIFNVLGEEVMTLVNEVKSAGRYRIVFNAGNLPSGVYFYRINTNGYSETKKLMLLK